MCHSILVTYIVYHTWNEVVSIVIVCMKGQKSDFMSNSAGTNDKIPFILQSHHKTHDNTIYPFTLSAS